MPSRLDRTIAELEDLVTKHQRTPECGVPNALTSRRTDVLFLLPKQGQEEGQPLVFDDVWITVWTYKPERDALRLAGFTTSSEVQDRPQGTESVRAEFQNAFLELTWLQSSSSATAKRIDDKSLDPVAWRSNEWRAQPASGSLIEIQHAGQAAKERALRVGFSARSAGSASEESGPGTGIVHALKVRRVTSVRLVAPAKGSVGAVETLRMSGMLALRIGTGWAVEITFDDGVQRNTTDLRPAVPVIVKY